MLASTMKTMMIHSTSGELKSPMDSSFVENPPVAQLLYKTAKIDREIPEQLYQAVAELLAYVYKLDPRRGTTWRAA